MLDLAKVTDSNVLLCSFSFARPKENGPKEKDPARGGTKNS